MAMMAHTMSILLIMMIIFMTLTTMYKKLKLNSIKPQPFECGFNPLMKHQSSFSMRFFIFTILFIIFDVEIVLLLPMVPLYQSMKMETWTYISYSLIFTVLMGVYHEWKYNMLEWT